MTSARASRPRAVLPGIRLKNSVWYGSGDNRYPLIKFGFNVPQNPTAPTRHGLLLGDRQPALEMHRHRGRRSDDLPEDHATATSRTGSPDARARNDASQPHRRRAPAAAPLALALGAAVVAHSRSRSSSRPPTADTTRAKLEVVNAEGNDQGLNIIHWGKPWGGDYLGVPPIQRRARRGVRLRLQPRRAQRQRLQAVRRRIFALFIAGIGQSAVAGSRAGGSRAAMSSARSSCSATARQPSMRGTLWYGEGSDRLPLIKMSYTIPHTSGPGQPDHGDVLGDPQPARRLHRGRDEPRVGEPDDPLHVRGLSAPASAPAPARSRRPALRFALAMPGARPTLIEFPADDPERALSFWAGVLDAPSSRGPIGEGSDRGERARRRCTHAARAGRPRPLPYFTVPMWPPRSSASSSWGDVVHPGSNGPSAATPRAARSPSPAAERQALRRLGSARRPVRLALASAASSAPASSCRATRVAPPPGRPARHSRPRPARPARPTGCAQCLVERPATGPAGGERERDRDQHRVELVAAVEFQTPFSLWTVLIAVVDRAGEHRCRGRRQEAGGQQRRRPWSRRRPRRRRVPCPGFSPRLSSS